MPETSDPKEKAKDASDPRKFPSLDILFAALSGENLAKLTLPGGIIGKIGKVFIYVAVAFPIMVWAGAFVPGWVVITALSILAISSLLLTRWMLDFAEKNPQAALMEGAEFLVYEEKKMHFGTKAQPQLEVQIAEVIADPEKPPLKLPVAEQLDLGDLEPDAIVDGRVVKQEPSGNLGGADPKQLTEQPSPAKNPDADPRGGEAGPKIGGA